MRDRMPFVMDGGANHWPAMHRWTFDYLQSHCGAARVTVADTSLPDFPESEMHLEQFLERLHSDDDSGCPLYLVDWRFDADYPELLADVEGPDFVTDDWFSRFPADTRPVLRWMFIGGAGTKSDLHLDIWNTSAWLAVMRGAKELVCFAPSQSQLLYDGQLDPFNVDLDRFPLFAAVEPHVAMLRAGDIACIPSGWWHAARNHEPTIAVTANFVDASNVSSVRRELLRSATHLDAAAHDFVIRLAHQMAPLSAEDVATLRALRRELMLTSDELRNELARTEKVIDQIAVLCAADVGKEVRSDADRIDSGEPCYAANCTEGTDR